MRSDERDLHTAPAHDRASPLNKEAAFAPLLEQDATGLDELAPKIRARGAEVGDACPESSVDARPAALARCPRRHTKHSYPGHGFGRASAGRAAAAQGGGCG